ncbi:DUF448 domain-containing protein [Patescibacteria group bacterium]|nr:MAG: DUF448 domain-containing protein [Patescibacteria group bacterium]
MAEPQRSCRVCRTKRPQAQLQRWVRQGGTVLADTQTTGHQPGRGFYTCSSACANKLPAIIGQNRR